MISSRGLSTVSIAPRQRINWTEVNSGLMDLDVVSLVANETYLFAGTDSSGCWRRLLSELTTSVEPAQAKSRGIPAAPELPQPVQPTTVIRFQLPSEADVRLSVYDVLGREVAVLVMAFGRQVCMIFCLTRRSLQRGLLLSPSGGGFLQTQRLQLLDRDNWRLCTRKPRDRLGGGLPPLSSTPPYLRFRTRRLWWVHKAYTFLEQ